MVGYYLNKKLSLGTHISYELLSLYVRLVFDGSKFLSKSNTSSMKGNGILAVMFFLVVGFAIYKTSMSVTRRSLPFIGDVLLD